MKIVVQGSDGDAWWVIVNGRNVHVALSQRTFSSRSAAIKSAKRFVKEIGNAYYYEPFSAIKVEIEDPR